MTGVRRERIATSELTLGPRVYHNRCIDCRQDILIPFGDPRAEPKPEDRDPPGFVRCDRCGGICVPVNGPPPTYHCGCPHCTSIRSMS